MKLVYSENDMVVWMRHTHEATCYDKKRIIKDMFTEVYNGIYVRENNNWIFKGHLWN
jgi:hypothetical protein